MSLRKSCGIVGLPNVGKSTFFNAMTSSKLAETGNYPFCTIKANISKLPVYDKRLLALQSFCKSEKLVPSEIGLADVAGLIEGAHKGEGLGNQFLTDIRNVSVLLHMVRCFEDEPNGFLTPTPIKDIHIINSELVLADLAVVEKRLSRAKKVSKKGDGEVDSLQELTGWLEDGKPARTFSPRDIALEGIAKKCVQELQLLSSKPMIFVLNLSDTSFQADAKKYTEMIQREFSDSAGQSAIIPASANIEDQTSQLPVQERTQFLQEYGLEVPSSQLITRAVYTCLGLHTFYTVGPLMAHAWSIRAGTTARKAAGEIHTSFEEFFRSAKTLRWDRFTSHGNLDGAEAAMEGRDASYVMEDGEVLLVFHNTPKK